MKKIKTLAWRNALEMLRDPILYVFCLAFPVTMLALFQIINRYTNGMTPTFQARALVPGVMMFSFSFVMLTTSLLVSRDRSTALLHRLYAAPLHAHQFVLGYAIPSILVGVLQALVCIGTGAALSAICGGSCYSFLQGLQLILTQLPMLVLFVFLGILFGTLLNEKSAPGCASILISASGILGGAWMPLETMGEFERFCRCLPFYPDVRLGRIVTGAVDSFGNTYALDRNALLGLLPIVVWCAVSVVLSFVVFRTQMHRDN